MIWKEAVIVSLNALSQQLYAVYDEDHEKPQTEYPVSDTRFKPATAEI
jgi:hypothetical protein